MELQKLGEEVEPPEYAVEEAAVEVVAHVAPPKVQVDNAPEVVVIPVDNWPPLPEPKTVKARRWSPVTCYAQNTTSSQLSWISKVEQAYGDLDELYRQDELRGVIAALTYSSADERRGKPNPSLIPINGNVRNGLASYKAAISLYRRFLGGESDDSAGIRGTATEAEPATRVVGLGLEADLQRCLRARLDQLEAGLRVTDGGSERIVPSGMIDITAEDGAGNIVAIELKAGTATRAAVGQVLSYMDDLAEEEGAPVRGYLVAADFDVGALSAARMVPALTLRSYQVSFAFADPHKAADESAK